MREHAPLKGRAALVTGSINGLGLAMARKLASAGASIVLTGIESPAVAEETRLALAEEFGVQTHYLEADLRQRDQVRALIEQATTIAPIDILINNAVVRHFAPISEFPLEKWDEAIAVNLTAAMIATQMVLPGMRERGYGRIINMTSVYGWRGTVDRVDYVTTKTAIQGLTRATAMETAGSAVSCHALTPGSVLTPIWRERIDELIEKDGISREKAEERFLNGKQPSGKFIEMDSVTEVLLMLCGPVGQDMNGAILPIEGGWLARG